MNKIKKAMLMTFFSLFSLCSCGNSVPVGTQIDIADKITTSDISIDTIENDKEEDTSSTSTSSRLIFSFNAKNNSENLCDGSLDFDFDILNSIGAVVYSTKSDSLYNQYQIRTDKRYFYPGETTSVTAVVSSMNTYSFTKVENYTIGNLKATKAGAYKKTTVYSTESEEEKTKINISNIRIQEVVTGETTTETNFYRVDFQADFSVQTNKKNQYLSFASVTLSIGEKKFNLNLDSVELSENSCAYFFAKGLESTEGATISMKACLSKPLSSRYSTVGTVFLAIIIALLVLVPPILIGVIVAVVISKPKKAGK